METVYSVNPMERNLYNQLLGLDEKTCGKAKGKRKGGGKRKAKSKRKEESKRKAKSKRKEESKNKSKSKKRKTNKRGDDSKMVVHQIFFNIGKGELTEIPRFNECHKNNKKECKRQGIKYKLWTRKMVEKLLDKPKNKRFKKIYYDFSVDIMRIDFARYLILWNFGGIYIDLDICILGKSIKHLFSLDYFFVRWHDSQLPYNAILGTKSNNPLYLEILEHCEESYYEKRKQKIYKTWKGRFVFQTTGHFMLQRVLKKNKIKGYLDIVRIHAKDGRVVQGKKPLFEDTSASVWFDK